MTSILSITTNGVQGIFFDFFNHPKSGEEPKIIQTRFQPG